MCGTSPTNDCERRDILTGVSPQLIPQIVINYRRDNATGLQPSIMMLWAWAGVPLGVYNIVKGFNIALRIQPQILTLMSLITWIQCYYYESVSIPCWIAPTWD